MSRATLPPDPWGIMAALAELRAKVDEQAVEIARLRVALDSRPVLLTTDQAAQLVGRTPAALRMMVSKLPGGGCRRPDVAAARVGHGRDVRWKRDLLLAAFQSTESATEQAPLRAIAGGAK